MSITISCICVSRPERWGQLQRAITCFAKQTAAYREMIIVVQSPDFAALVRDFADTIPSDYPIKVYARAYAHSPTELMVAALVMSHGNWIALWDDDDLNRDRRLEMQLDLMKVKQASVLSNACCYFHDSNELFFMDCRQPAAPIAERTIPSTLILPRSLLPPLDHTLRGDTFAIGLLKSLVRLETPVLTIPDDGWHHLVGVSYDNVQGKRHRERAIKFGLPSARLAKLIPTPLATVSAYHWDVDSVDVVGPDARWVSVAVAEEYRWPVDYYPLQLKDPEVEETHEHVGIESAGS